MNYLVSSDEMKRIDEYTITQIGISSAVLMERAALHVAGAIMKAFGKTKKVIAVCGTGNNGGDAVAAARMLMCKGAEVAIYLCCKDEERYSEGLKMQLAISRKLGIIELTELNEEKDAVIIDGIFGTGLKREVSGIYREIIEKINSFANKTVYSVDIPSGICSDSGCVLGCAVRADYTLTFGLAKIGLMLFPGKEYSGKISICDIGFPEAAISLEEHEVRYISEPVLPKRKPDSNKGTYGKVLIVAGHGMSGGAAILAAKGAYRAGAGLVKVLTSRESAGAVLAAIPEAIVDTYETEEGGISGQKLREGISFANVVAFGMGIGTDSLAEELFDILMEEIDKPLVLDADGLNLLAKRGFDDYLFRTPTVITPHMMELSRLLGRDVKEVKQNIMSIAHDFRKRGDITYVLKDAATVVVSEQGIFVNTTGNDGMSTGGSGDVLAGVIASFIAQGLTVGESAVSGVFLHGLAGDRAASKMAKQSIIAGDIADALEELMVSK